MKSYRFAKKAALFIVLMLFASAFCACGTMGVEKEIEIGDIITFGSYWQGSSEVDGKTPIEWIVLDKHDGKLLIVSKYALDVKPLDESKKILTWEGCSLRIWLNGAFLNAAFSEEEQRIIVASTISNHDNPQFGTEGGNNTGDKVFLLSVEETEEYFQSDEERRCIPTDYAVAQGLYSITSNVTGESYSPWWLRSPGDIYFGGQFGSNFAYVSSSGEISYEGVYQSFPRGIRPALWIISEQ